MSEKERDTERHDGSQTEEQTEDPTGDDFEAHRHDAGRHIERDAERDDSSGFPNRDADPGRNVD